MVPLNAHQSNLKTQSKRVVITGMSMISPLGNNWTEMRQQIELNKNAVVHMADWLKYKGLHSLLAAPVNNLELPEHYDRKLTRSMGRVSIMACRTAELALAQANLLNNPILKEGEVGVSYGSSSGSVDATIEFYSMIIKHAVEGINSTSYLRSMSHTCAVNIGLLFGLTGRLIPTGTACTSGSLAIGYAYEAIKHGYQKIMIAGGAEELSPTQVAVFDTLYATSTKNNTPTLTPKPFDKHRDGIVIGEGAGTLILEELESALERGATILAEIVGFATNTDGTHLTRPNSITMERVMQQALESCQLTKEDIGYINAHGTATQHGDIAEGQAVYRLFGNKTPISSLKSFIGHTLGACGALEAIASINMLHESFFIHNLNLQEPDPACGDLDFIMNKPRTLETKQIMSNNFAFGGINTSLIFKKFDPNFI